MKRIFLIPFFITLLCVHCLSQEEVNLKREFRGVWIATVSNIDWPSKPGLPAEKQKQEFIELLDYHEAMGVNAVIVQIRPASDALYNSNYEPWSYWLTGKQGKKPKPYYDPLEFMIKEAHQRNMEFHAWVNPFRATISENTKTRKNHITRKHPEWILKYAGQKVINPGIPGARAYIINVINDIVRRYDIDAIHFDDYFYPYPENGEVFPDEKDFKKNKTGFDNIDDWRRNNIDILIKGIHDSINTIKPEVKFGISPFGIWRNKKSDSLGSSTLGLPSYDAIYADSRKWLQNGWIDYIVPQIYWSLENKYASYDTLVNWWNKNAFNRHLYIGHSAYKIFDDKDKAWQDLKQIPNQVKLNRSLKNVDGSVFFSSKVLVNNKGFLADSLKNTYYKFPALLPLMPWKDSIPPEPPMNLQTSTSKKGIFIRWDEAGIAADGDKATAYVIYRFTGESYSPTLASSIAGIVNSSVQTFLDTLAFNIDSVTYGVTALDNMHNESIICLKTKAFAKAKIRQATVYIDGAEITRNVQAQVSRKPTRLILEKLPPSIKPSSLRVETKEPVELISYKHSLYRPMPILTKQEEKTILDSIAYFESLITSINDSLEVYSNKQNFLLENQKITGTTAVKSIEDIKSFNEYFSDQLFTIKKKQRNLHKHKNLYLLKINELENKYPTKDINSEKKYSRIEIAVVSSKNVKGNLNIKYFTDSAAWDPFYHLHYSSDSLPVALNYYASVWQKTGENWQDIKLKLASISKDFSQGQFFKDNLARYSLQDLRSGEIQERPGETLIESNISSHNRKQIIEPVSIHTSRNNVNLETSVSPTNILYKKEQLNLHYIYKNLLDEESGLMKTAILDQWDQLGIYPGKMEVFFKETRVNSFDMLLGFDTLFIPIIKTTKIKIKKEEFEAEKKFSVNIFRKKKQLRYTIEIKNDKNVPVNIHFNQPVPSSTHKDLQIGPFLERGIYDKKDQMLHWKFTLQPREKRTLNYKFILNYPIGMEPKILKR